jgi:hypothetical protein
MCFPSGRSGWRLTCFNEPMIGRSGSPRAPSRWISGAQRSVRPRVSSNSASKPRPNASAFPRFLSLYLAQIRALTHFPRNPPEVRAVQWRRRIIWQVAEVGVSDSGSARPLRVSLLASFILLGKYGQVAQGSALPQAARRIFGFVYSFLGQFPMVAAQHEAFFRAATAGSGPPGRTSGGATPLRVWLRVFSSDNPGGVAPQVGQATHHTGAIIF